MKKILIVVLITFFTFAQAKEQKKSAVMGFLTSNILLEKFKESRIALSLWLDSVGKYYGIKIIPKYYKSVESISNAYFNEKSVDCITFPSYYYFENKEKIDKYSDTFWALSSKERGFLTYYLIAQKTSNKTLKDLKSSTLGIKNDKYEGSIWLDKRSLEINKKPYKKVASKIIKESKESTLLLNVFFKKIDFAVVEENTWKTMIELNPAIGKTLKIVEKTKNIHTEFIGFFKKNFDPELKKLFFEASSNLESLPQGKQIITLIKFNKVFRLDEKMLKDLGSFHYEYNELKKRYIK